MLKELVPGIKRVLYAFDVNDTASERLGHKYFEASQPLGIAMVLRPLESRAEAERYFDSIRRRDADAMISPYDTNLDIPVEVNHNIELIINLKVAQERGLKNPPMVLYQADRIIR